jgi:hypothetical protein
MQKPLVDANAGRIESARDATDEGMPLALQLGVIPAYFELRAARGFLELSLGQYQEAYRFLGSLATEVVESGFIEPSLFRYHGDLAETLVAIGKLDEAASIVAELEERAARLAHPWAAAVGARSRALHRAAAGDLRGGLAAAEEALELHELLGQPVELARAQVVVGTLRRRNRGKRPARDSLQAALDVFTRLVATLWAERTRSELARVGGRSPVSAALTPTERMVADLVAAGGTYCEVARRSVHESEDRAVEPLQDLSEAGDPLSRPARCKSEICRGRRVKPSRPAGSALARQRNIRPRSRFRPRGPGVTFGPLSRRDPKEASHVSERDPVPDPRQSDP